MIDKLCEECGGVVQVDDGSSCDCESENQCDDNYLPLDFNKSFKEKEEERVQHLYWPD